MTDTSNNQPARDDIATYYELRRKSKALKGALRYQFVLTARRLNGASMPIHQIASLLDSTSLRVLVAISGGQRSPSDDASVELDAAEYC